MTNEEPLNTRIERKQKMLKNVVSSLKEATAKVQNLNKLHDELVKELSDLIREHNKTKKMRRLSPCQAANPKFHP